MICPEKPKCSNTDHKDVDASVFCPSCNKFFCPSCDKALHKTVFTDHQPVPIADLQSGSKAIITGKCDSPGHHNNPLEYYCKDHNVPCCAVCLCPKEDVGKHSKCQTVPLKDMEHHMRSTMGSVIKKLESAVKSAEDSMERIISVQEKNEEVKNGVISQIKTSFTAIREAVDAREKELLANVEKLWKKESSCEGFIEINNEYPEKAKQIVEAAKKVEKRWDTNHLPEMAQHYGLVADTTKELVKFNSDVDDVISKNLKIVFNLEKDGIDAFIGEIKKFGDVSIKPKYVLSMKESPNNKYVLEGPNRSIIRKISSNYWDCTAIGSNTLPLNAVIRWNVKIISTEYGNMFIGVAPFDIDQVNANCNYSKCGWYFWCNNSALYSGPPHKYNGKSYGEGKNIKKGDAVGVTMDTITGKLSFSVNGENFGVAFSEIPLGKPLVPAIDLEIINDFVEIIQY